MKHPIAKLLENGFDHFFRLASEEVEAGRVDRTDLDNLTLLDYSRDCQFGESWNLVNELCRGLIVDRVEKRIVALTIPKFFNLNERGNTFKNLPYSCTEKMDGSMGVVWFHNNRWNVSTRGSFSSPQAIKGYEMLRDNYPRFHVCTHPKITYICEIIYPENRIVVDYGKQEKLVLLAAFDTETHEELDDDVLDVVAEASGLERPNKYKFNSFLELETTVKAWPKEQEGVVIRFSDGHRIKIKAEIYCNLHKTLSHFSPLSVWEAVRDNVEIDYIKQLPDEFQDQYKLWRSDFLSQAQKIWEGVVRLHEATKHLSDKELGLKVQSKELGDYGGMIFAIRKNGATLESKKSRNWVFEKFRPTANNMKRFEG